VEEVGPPRRGCERLDVEINFVGTVHVNTMYKVTSSNFLPVTAGRHSLEIGTARSRGDGISQRRSGVACGEGSGVGSVYVWAVPVVRMGAVPVVRMGAVPVVRMGAVPVVSMGDVPMGAVAMATAAGTPAAASAATATLQLRLLF